MSDRAHESQTRVTKDNLRPEARYAALVLFYVSTASALLLMFLLPMALAISYAVLAGIVMVATRNYVVLQLDFTVLYQLWRLGQQLVKILAIPFLILMGVVLTPADWAPFLHLYWGVIFIVMIQPISAGAVLSQYLGAIAPGTVVVLCLTQAKQAVDRYSKLAWVRRAFEHLRSCAGAFDLDLNTSEFERYFAIRLFEGKKIDVWLNRISTSVSAGKLALRTIPRTKTHDLDYVRIAKGGWARWTGYFERLGSFREAVLFAIALLQLIVYVFHH